MKTINSNSNFNKFILLAFLLAFISAPPWVFSDDNVDFKAKDDLTVLGTGGTDSDPDVEVKGYSEFGIGAPNSSLTTIGAGSVYIQKDLEVDEDVDIAKTLTVAGPISAGSAGDVGIEYDLYLANITAATIKSYGNLTIQAGTGNLNRDLVLKPSGTGLVKIGTGSTNHGLSGAGDLFIQGDVEIDGAAYLDGGVFLGDTTTDNITVNGAATFQYLSTMNNTLDMANNLITNIGSADTDFTTGGGLIVAGNVGIGTTAPTAPLAVGNNAFKVASNGTVSAGIWQGTAVVDTYVADALTISGGTINTTSIGATVPSTGVFTTLSSTQGTNLATTSGNVGIGTTGPGAQLHIQGSSGTVGKLLLSSVTANAAGAGSQITLSEGGFTDTYGFRFIYDGNTDIFNILSGSTTLTEKLTIVRDSGNVGIGTTAPGNYKLNVNGPVNISGALDVTGTVTAAGLAGATSTSGTSNQYFAIDSDFSDVNPELRFQTGSGAYKSIAYDETNTEFDFNDVINLSANALITTGNLSDGTNTLTVANAKTAYDHSQTSSGSVHGLTLANVSQLGSTIESSEITDGTITSTDINDGTIMNADVNTSAGIAGTKIAPDFGSQTVVTTGNIGIGTILPTSKLHGLTTMSTATGNETAYQLAYTTNKATSGNDTGLLIAMTDTLSPGTSRLLDLQVGGGTKFNVDNAGNTDIQGNLVVQGDLSIQGTQTILNTQTVEIESNELKLNRNVTGAPSLDASIVVERGTSTDTYIKWDEANDKWVMYNGTSILDIANPYTAGDGLTLTGQDFDVNVDASTIEINADALRVKDAGITSAKIAADTIVAGDIATSAVETTEILDGTIGNVDINASAGIAGTKIAPDFGTQALVTTGNVGIGTVVTSSYKLNVLGNTNITGNLEVSGTVTATGLAGATSTSGTNNDTFAIDANYDGVNPALRFQTGAGTYKSIIYDETNTEFDFDDAVNVTGGITASNGLTVSAGTVSLPADSITDAMVSNTLTASDLTAGSAVVADSEVVDALTISGGTINATSVGAAVASTGAFTTLSSTQGTNLATASGNVGIGTIAPTALLAVGNNAFKVASNGTVSAGTWQGTAVGDTYVSDVLTISGGTINNTVIGGTVSAAGTFTNLTASGTVSLPNNSVTDAMVSNTLTASDLVAGTAVVADSEVVDALTISGGTINATSVGATVASTGAFTTLSSTQGTNLATASGNVGIGTTAPVYHLDFRGGSAGGNILYVEGNNLSNGTGAKMILSGASYSNILNIMAATSSSGGSSGINLSSYTANKDASIFLDEADSQKLKINVNRTENINTLGSGTNAMTIDIAGNVGVGTTVPGNYKLNVNGPVNISGALDVTGAVTASGLAGATSTSGTSNQYFAIDSDFSDVNPELRFQTGSGAYKSIVYDETNTEFDFNDDINITGGVTASNGLTVSAGTVSLPADSIIDTMVSNTLTASDLAAGSAVVADSEVVDALTISGGTINNTSVGATVASTGAFTTLSSTQGTTLATASGNIGVGTVVPTSKLHGLTTLNTATGNETAYQLAYTTNKATSGNDTGLLIAMTDTLSPGTSRLLDLQVGGSTKFNVDNAGNTDIQGNLVVQGDLTIQGTQTILNTQTVEIESNELKLNRNVTGAPSLDASIIVERGTSTDTYIKWDEANDKWVMSNGTSVLDIANPYTAGDGLTLTGQDFDVNVDASTIEINADTLRVKDAGITSAKIAGDTIAAGDIATGAVETTEILDGTIANVDINASAAIAGTKIAPDFGSQNILTTGNVGIGTIGPSALLHLSSGSVRVTSASNDTWPTLANAPIAGEIHASNITTSGSDRGTLILSAGGETGLTAKMSLILQGYGSTDSTQARFQYGNTAVMTLKNTGNVGIGTTAPVQKLDVSGNTKITGNLEVSGTVTATGLAGATSTSGTNNQYFAVDADYNDVNPEIRFQTGAGTSKSIAYDETGTEFDFNDDINLSANALITTGNLSDGTNTLTIANAKTSYDHSQATSGTVHGLTLANVSQLGSAIESGEITDGTIMNADVNASAGIAGTKIAPDFGAQNIITTGNATISGDVTVDTDTFKIDSTRNMVGIGTIAPEAKLDIIGPLKVTTAGDVRISHDLYFGDITASAINSYGPLTITSGNSNSNYNLVLKGTGTGKVYVDDDLQVTGDLTLPGLSIPSSGTITFGSDASIQRSAADTIATASGDNFTVNGNLTVTGNSSVGTVTSGTWQGTAVGDTYVSDALTISGGTINGTSVGATVPSTGVFTTVTTSGNVGIGTAGPGAYLDVAGSATNGKSLILRSGDSNMGTDSNQIIFGYNDTLTYQHAIKTRHNSSAATGNDIDFYLWNYGTDASDTIGTKHVMTLEGSGNVGIGTTAPGYKLDVQGNASIGNTNTAVQDLRLQRSNGGINVVRHWYTHSNNSPSYTYGENLAWNGERAGTVESTHAYRPYYEAFAPAAGYKEFGFVNLTSGAFTGSNMIPSLVLVNTGNVGIGTTAPGSYKLNVNGPVNISGALDVTGTVTAAGLAGATSTSGTSNQYFAIDSDFSDVNPELRFQTGSGAYKSIAYDETNTEFDFNDDVNITGGVISSNGLTVSAGTVSLPANSITDAMVSNTLTASDLSAGSAVVADSEVVDALTISGGTINATSVGATVASTGAFTTLSSAQGTTLATASGNIGIGTIVPTSKLHGLTTMSTATGNETAYQLAYTTNKATSGNDTGLLIAMTDTLSPGTSRLLDLQVGGSTKFNVDNAGNIWTLGNLTLGGYAYRENLQELYVKNNKIYLNYGQANLNNDAYISAVYGDTPTVVSSLRYDNSNSRWELDKPLSLTTGNTYKIAGTDVLTGSALGAGITASSLTSVGTLTNLSVSGNIGIGTTAPLTKLDVFGGDISISANQKINLEGSSGDSYIKFDSANNRFDLYINNAKVGQVTSAGTLQVKKIEEVDSF